MGKACFLPRTRVVCVVFKPRLGNGLRAVFFLVRVGVAGASEKTTADSYESQNAVVADYCVMCHSDEARTAGFSLESFDVGRAEESAPVAEKSAR